MSYAAAKTITIDEIPVIDVRPLRSGNRQAMQEVARQLRQAAEGTGFFYIRNHCILSQVIQQAYGATKQFFQQPKDWKNQLQINYNHHGFLAVGQAKMEKATRVDLKESFVWGLDLPDEHPDLTEENPFLGRNQWPSQMPEFRASVYPFFEAGLECGKEMMRAFALSLDLPEEVFLQATNQPIARSSVIYYPPQSLDLGETQFGVAPHTDYGCLTLLWQMQWVVWKCRLARRVGHSSSIRRYSGGQRGRPAFSLDEQRLSVHSASRDQPKKCRALLNGDCLGSKL